MKKIYATSEDKYVKSVILYGQTEDSKLYTDSAYTGLVSKSDFEDLFAKGVVIVYDGSTYAPVSYSVADKKCTAVIIKLGASDALTGVKLTTGT